MLYIVVKLSKKTGRYIQLGGPFEYDEALDFVHEERACGEDVRNWKLAEYRNTWKQQ